MRLSAPPLRPILAALLSLVLAAGYARAAAPDNNVEWDGVSHVSWLDLRPLCPVNGESFEVRFQAFQNDLTAARVQVDDGAIQSIDASVAETRGPYDIWSASVPSTAASGLAYFLELTDGSDVDYYSAGGMSDTVPGDGGFALDFATLEHAPLGATQVTGGTVFRVWSPGATTAHLRGDFNGWGLSHPMTPAGDFFVTFFPGTADRQMYKYFFSGSTWKPDARARSLNASLNYNSHIEDPFRYVWTSGDFPTPPLESMVIYQLHVGTFAGRNDPVGSTPFPSRFSDLAARVSHLEELGVNAILLNPITEFPFDLSAGYNPITQWAPEWKYGTPDQFKNLVDTCHQHGIAVLLDIVWNHFDSTDNYLWHYDGTQIYFDVPTVETPWGSQADFDEPEVQDYFADSGLAWLEEYRIDGYRMDATDFMNIAPQAAAGWALMQRMNDEIDNRYAQAVTIAEQLPDDSFVTRPTSLGGAGFDSQYHDAFTDQLRQEIFDSATGNPEMWRIRNIVNGSGAFMNGEKVLNYLELHDEAWPTSGGQRMVKTIDSSFPHDNAFARGRTKLGQGLVLLAPGVPAFLQGTEWLEDTDFGTAAGNRIDWSKKETYSDVFAYYRDIIALRRGTPAFRANAAHSVSHVNDTSNVLGFTRSDGLGAEFLVLASFSNSDASGYRVGVPDTGPWVEVLNSQALAYGGNGLTNPGALPTDPISADGFAQSLVLTVPRMGLLVLSNDASPVATPEPGDPGRPRLELAFANPMVAETVLSFELARPGPVRIEVYDARGRRLTTLLEATRAAGRHRVSWDGTDANGRSVGAGVYFVRLQAGDEFTSRKLTLLR